MIDLYKDELEALNKRILAYQRGNTLLIENLMWVCAQYTEFQDGVTCRPHYSAERTALNDLVVAGFAECDSEGTYRLLWDKLQERKKEVGLDV